MSIEWYRVYHGMPEDAKLKVIAKRSKQLMTHVVTVWLCVLDAASRHKTRGTVLVDSEQIAVVQDIDQRVVESIMRAFYEKGMIDQNHRLTGWEKRQYASDSERAKKYRDGKKEEDAPANESSHAVTPRHAPSHEVVTSNAKSRKNRKNAPDTDSRVQNTDSDGESEKDKNSDKKLKTHTEKRESEREKQKISGQATDAGNQILEQMLDIWNEEVQSKLTKGQKAILTPKRKEQMTCRWLEDFQQDMRAWRYYCEIIGASNFCLGKREGKEGKAWTIDLGWAVASSDNVARIMEGGFSGGNHPPKPPACEVPELQQPWDTVLAYLAQKHGKSCIRSWFAATTITRMLRYGDGAVVVIRCPNQFIQEWISQRYLADLNQRWMEVTANDARVIRIELTVEG